MLKKFRKSTHGGVAIITALAATMLLGAAGAAIDYSRYSDMKTVYAAAADAAALSAAAAAANQSGMTDKQIQAEAKARALAAWKANLTAEDFKNLPKPKVTLVTTAGGYSATISYARPIPTSFLAVVGMTNIELTGMAQAASGPATGRYWEIHIAIDTSSSMGIGATQSDMDKMQKDPKIGCAFACHWSAKGGDSVTFARDSGYTLRVDVVDQAVDGMIGELKKMSAVKTKAALYGLETKLNTLVPLTSDLTSIANHDIQLALTTQSVGNSNFRSSFAGLSATVGPDGTGDSAAKPKKAVFIVTDGVHDANVVEPNAVVTPWKDHSMGPISAGFCKSMKAKGVTVGILYINYITPKGFEPWIDPFKKQVEPSLQACASDGMFYNATSPNEIQKALKDMLGQAMESEIRLTQ